VLQSFKNLTIQGNTVSFYGPEGFGTSNNLHAGMNLGAMPWLNAPIRFSNLVVVDNTISDSPSAGIIVDAPVEGAKICGNTINRPARTAGGLSEKYASGICLGGTMKDVACENNTLVDDQTARRMKTAVWQQGLHADSVTVAHNTVTITDGAKTQPPRRSR
jgi:hypothetical protein